MTSVAAGMTGVAAGYGELGGGNGEAWGGYDGGGGRGGVVRDRGLDTRTPYLFRGKVFD